MMTSRKIGTSDVTYGAPFLGPVDHRATVAVKINTLTAAEVDASGNLKPGVAFKNDGTLCNATANEFVYGVIIAPTPLGRSYAISTANLAADAGTVTVAVGTHGVVQRDICEDNLGRAYNANELAAFARPGCHLALTRT